MAVGDHINMQTKRGCRIITSDPVTRTIEGKIQRGEIIQINAFYTGAFFRWPKVGENWIVREENGSWFLEGLFQDGQDTVQITDVDPGDAVVNSDTIRLTSGVLIGTRINEAGKTELIARFKDDETPHVLATES